LLKALIRLMPSLMSSKSEEKRASDHSMVEIGNPKITKNLDRKHMSNSDRDISVYW
jgi:hypothetical protein